MPSYDRAGGGSGAAAELLPAEPAALDHGVGQHVADLGLGAERIGQHVQPAARPGRDAVVLVAHVVVDRAMPLDEQDLVEIQQRVGKGDLPADAADLLEQRQPRGCVGHVGLLALGPQFSRAAVS